MDNPQGQSTSFIPQRPTRGKVKKGGVRKIYILSYVSYVFFFFTLITAAGIYFYEFTLSQELEQQKERLASERERFSQTDIQRIKDIDNRIDTAQERLDKHLAVSGIFTALETTTIDPVHFLEFFYSRTIDDVPTVTFTGSASDYDAVLFQREVLKANPVLADVKVHEVTYAPNAEGTELATHAITFALDGTLDEASISYEPQNQETISEIGELVDTVENDDVAEEDQPDQTAEEPVSDTEVNEDIE